MKFKLITQELTLKEVGLPQEVIVDIVDKVGKSPDEIPFVRKGYTMKPEDVSFKEGERAAIDFITTESIDRDFEVIEPNGVDISHYKLHPVVLFGHNYRDLPIGKSAWLKKGKTKSGADGLIAKTIYAETPEAERVWQYRRSGFPLAKSIGFVPLEWETYNEEKFRKTGVRRRYTKVLLLEHSDVSVPSNPEALEIAVSKGLFGEMTKHDIFEQYKDWIETPDEFFDDIEDKGEKYLCECIKCGHKLETDKHCKNIKCPKCGGTMRRAERPGPGEEGKGEEFDNIDRDIVKVWEDKPETIFYRIRDPKQFQEGSFRTIPIKRDKPRVNGIIGKLKGENKTTLQALRFPKGDGWTLDKAKKWVADHPEIKKDMDLEPYIIDEVKRSIRAQMAAVLGARGGVKISDDRKEQTWNILCFMAERFGVEYPDRKEYSQDELKEMFDDIWHDELIDLVTREMERVEVEEQIAEGKILTKENAEKVQKAIDALDKAKKSLEEVNNATQQREDKKDAGDRNTLLSDIIKDVEAIGGMLGN